MSKFFKISGAIYLIISVGLLLYSIISSESTLFSIVITSIIIGLALIAIGDLMDRVDSLEKILNKSRKQNENGEKIQQRKCLHCDKSYDIDYPKCPYCGYKNDII